MLSHKFFGRIVLATTAVVLTGSLAVGVFLIGFHVGEQRALHKISEIMTGERPVDEMEELCVGQMDSEAKYATRGWVVSKGSGELTVEDSRGQRNQVLVSPETSVHAKGVVVPKEEVQEGDMVFVVGKPSSSESIMRAKIVRILGQPQ